MGIVSLQDVSMEFGSIRALDRVTMRINSGDMLSIIGPNGAGKTTLLRIIAGLLEPTSGRILFKGNLLSGGAGLQLRRVVTLVFQRPVAFSTTVFKNVAYGLRIRLLPEKEVASRVKSALEMVQLYDLHNRQARHLSGGEQKRLNLAMSIVTDPEILLLDEPTAFLDHESRTIVEDALRELNKGRGTAIVISTHDMMQAGSLSRNAALLQDGRISRIGLTSDVVRDRLEALLFEDTTLNVFTGKAQFMNGLHVGEHLVRVRISESVSIEAITNREGDVTIRIPPEDIVLSKGVILSSARNSLSGKVVDIASHEAMVLVTVDVGIPLVAQITAGSLERLEVSTGDHVNVTFKASSVRVY